MAGPKELAYSNSYEYICVDIPVVSSQVLEVKVSTLSCSPAGHDQEAAYLQHVTCVPGAEIRAESIAELHAYLSGSLGGR